MNDKELDDILLDNGLEGSSYFVNYNYDTAILGYTENNNIVYSYDKMVDYLVDNTEMTDEEAMEFIDYNTIRTVPYMDEPRPIIVYEMIK